MIKIKYPKENLSKVVLDYNVSNEAPKIVCYSWTSVNKPKIKTHNGKSTIKPHK